ncbi:uncharacterized protein LOC124437032 [Xenia sp. Carnegie-2017]|uniref:uncharacterized protein LOC124437032 n=1 Tax=Xenia sp. Carnegie-2017 TaxID=2897299 RepID=UPI001F038294|nr:uncharacterized protein LOC124437032 [Xenia sp. Carnegie-2017]
MCPVLVYDLCALCLFICLFRLSKSCEPGQYLALFLDEACHPCPDKLENCEYQGMDAKECEDSCKFLFSTSVSSITRMGTSSTSTKYDIMTTSPKLSSLKRILTTKNGYKLPKKTHADTKGYLSTSSEIHSDETSTTSHSEHKWIIPVSVTTPTIVVLLVILVIFIRKNARKRKKNQWGSEKNFNAFPNSYN